jgi:hypothetical protein
LGTISRSYDADPLFPDITVFSDIDARAAAGNFLQVPLLAGTTQHEEDIFLAIQEGSITGTPVLTEMLSDIRTQVCRHSIHLDTIEIPSSARIHLSNQQNHRRSCSRQTTNMAISISRQAIASSPIDPHEPFSN